MTQSYAAGTLGWIFEKEYLIKMATESGGIQKLLNVQNVSIHKHYQEPGKIHVSAKIRGRGNSIVRTFDCMEEALAFIGEFIVYECDTELRERQ